MKNLLLAVVFTGISCGAVAHDIDTQDTEKRCHVTETHKGGKVHTWFYTPSKNELTAVYWPTGHKHFTKASLRVNGDEVKTPVALRDQGAIGGNMWQTVSVELTPENVEAIKTKRTRLELGGDDTMRTPIPRRLFKCK